MSRRRLRLDPARSIDQLGERFAAIRAELGVPASFPPDVVAQAQASSRRTPAAEVDLRALPFVTIDPVGATDLDQAMCLHRRGSGYRVDYAIADVPAFVDPGDAVAREALRRGQTIYAPDGRTPLHPPVLSEDAASLLPDQDRAAFVWRFELDGAGEVERVELARAVIRSRQQLDYGQVQRAADSLGATPVAGASRHHGPADDLPGLAALLREIGERRMDLERARGGASLPLPDQEVVHGAHGYAVQLRPPVPAEDWNAQLSLMTGMAAASIMLKAGHGILRTLPPPDPRTMSRFRRQVRALGVDWPQEQSYGQFLHGLDSTNPRHLALLHSAGALFRGAGYLPLLGEIPPEVGHAAVAAPYAHVTAPLRRLVDRFGLVACLAVEQGGEVPDWVRAALPLLPAAMMSSDRLAGEVERRCLDAVEAAVLSSRTEPEWTAVVVDVDDDKDGGHVQLLDPVVLARCSGPLRLGEQVRVRRAEPSGVAAAGGADNGPVRFVRI